MSGPYRTRGKPVLEEEEEPAVRSDLGEVKSSHWRERAVGHLLAAAVGGAPTLEVRRHGLALRRNPVGPLALTLISFDEIDAVYYDPGLISGRPRITLVGYDGARNEIPSDVNDLDRVIQAIDREVTRPITARAKEALARGDRLTFGPLELELDGIVLNGASLSWDDLVEVVAERDSLVIYAPERRFGWVPLKNLPHPRALLDVLRVRTNVVMSGLQLDAADE